VILIGVRSDLRPKPPDVQSRTNQIEENCKERWVFLTMDLRARPSRTYIRVKNAALSGLMSIETSRVIVLVLHLKMTDEGHRNVHMHSTVPGT
jgi:hypothetical protein